MENQSDTMSFDLMIDISARLRGRIIELGVPQKQIAQRAGITPQRLNNYLQRGTLPDVETLVRLAAAVSVTTDWLLGLSDTGPLDIRPIVLRLLELDGMGIERARPIAEAAQEAVRILSALPAEGDAVLRSRLAAQAAWQSQASPRPN